MRKAAGRVVRRTLADGTFKEYRYGAYKPKRSHVAANSVAALKASYMRSPAWTGLAKLTKESYTTYLRPLDRYTDTSVKDVSRRDILTIRDAIALARGNGAATGFMRATSVLFKWAVENSWLDRSPVYNIKRLPGGELPAWNVHQADTALSGLAEHLRRAVVLGLYTGQRRGDLCSALWSAYDGEELKFIQQKTKVAVTIKVTAELKAELDEWRETATQPTILTNGHGKPWRPHTLSRALPEALQKLGIPKGLNVHGMRKLFAAGLAGNGATVHEIAASTGHKTLSMVELYTRSADRKKLAAEASAKIQRFTTERKIGYKAP